MFILNQRITHLNYCKIHLCFLSCFVCLLITPPPFVEIFSAFMTITGAWTCDYWMECYNMHTLLWNYYGNHYCIALWIIDPLSLTWPNHCKKINVPTFMLNIGGLNPGKYNSFNIFSCTGEHCKALLNMKVIQNAIYNFLSTYTCGSLSTSWLTPVQDLFIR